MKIALLNLPVDNNYGGMLQRYALMQTLKSMGHDVVHLNMRFPSEYKTWKKRWLVGGKQILGLIIHPQRIRFFYRHPRGFLLKEPLVLDFYQHHIKHTKRIFNYEQLSKIINGYDVYLVGSDQVWRKRMTSAYGIGTYFFDFVPMESKSRIVAYGVSFGTDENELDEKDVDVLTDLYKRFNDVSVREYSALEMLDQYGWIAPKARFVLDPAFLLDKECYCRLIDSSATKALEGKLFCYILDKNYQKEQWISRFASDHSLMPFYISVSDDQPSVEQWLRSFRDAEYIVTDSYHGLVYSTLFNKPFFLFNNESRGNARFDSLISALYDGTDIDNPDWKVVNGNIDYYKGVSLGFLRNVLE